MKTEIEIRAEIAAFIQERNEAFMSLDEHKIRTHQRKWNGTELPENMEVFWGSVHTMITGAPSIPIEFRRKSKAYLEERGLQSMDDGDL